MKFVKLFVLCLFLLIRVSQAQVNPHLLDSAFMEQPMPDTIEGSIIIDMLDSLDQVNLFIDVTNDTSSSIKPDEQFQLSALDSIAIQRLLYLNANSPFPFVYNYEVKRYIDLYTNKRGNLTSRMLALSEYYFPLFEEYLDKYKLPMELKYLSIVESALNPTAKSRAGAGGLWQFMLGTARMYNLRVNSYIDERFEPILATDAACRLFIDLYKMYNDWALVLAAYNSGPGNVNKAIRRANGEMDFWKIMHYLPRETQGYVPAFIAVCYVMHYASELGIQPAEMKYTYEQIDTVYVRKPLSFAQIAEFLDVPMEDIIFFNPLYKTGFIPADSNQLLPLRLRSDKILEFVSREAEIYKFKSSNQQQYEQFLANLKAGATMGSKYQRDVHIVKKGEVLGSIARKYHVTTKDLMVWNDLKNHNIHVGQKLIVERPIKQQSSSKNNKSSTAQSKPVPTVGSDGKPVKYIYHTVQPGDTLWDIARKYNSLTVEQIQKLNNLDNPRSLKLGQKLKVGIAG